MSPPARQRGRSSRAQPRGDVSSSEEETDSGSSAPEDEDEDEDPTFVRSPSKLTYRIDGLEPEVRSAVRDTFREPPIMTLQVCRQRGNVYAFQMTELVYQSIRIGSPNGSLPSPQCSCGQTSPPCRHVLWLMDRLAKETLYDRSSDAPLNLTPHGYPEEIGHPFHDISKFHLDLLADSLHCDVTDGDGDGDEDEDHRALEARELLASVAELAPEKYRTDLTGRDHRGKKAFKRGDLECTVFRMLLENREFFRYFRSRTKASRPRAEDPVNDPFRKLSHRVTRLLRKLDRYSASIAQSPQAGTPTTATTTSSTSSRRLHTPEPPCTVPWAAHHILGITSVIRTHATPSLPPARRTSAARTLIRILSAVSDSNHDAHPGPTPRDRNLYARLIAHRDDNFVLPLLFELLDAATPFLHNLEVILGRIAVHGAPPSYVARIEELVGRMREFPQARSSPAGAGSKRHGQGGQDRSSKRMK